MVQLSRRSLLVPVLTATLKGERLRTELKPKAAARAELSERISLMKKAVSWLTDGEEAQASPERQGSKATGLP